MTPWTHRYLSIRHGSIQSGHGTIDDANKWHLDVQRRAGFRIDPSEVIDTWSEPGHQVPVVAENNRVLWYKWVPGEVSNADDDPLVISARFAAMELR